MRILDRVRLAEIFAAPLTICTTVFPHLITFCIRLMFNLVRVGKEWTSPVFPHPLKSKGYMCIHDRVRLAVLFHRRLTKCTTVFPHPITFWTRLMFNLVRVGKEWAGPGFMRILDRVRLAEFFPTPLTICTTVFPHLVTFCTRLMFKLVRVGKEWAGPGFMRILDRVRLAEFFPTPLTICTTVFPHLVTFCTRLMFKLVRVGKEWASPVFPHPLTRNFRFYAYSWQGKVGWVFPPPH